MTPTHHRDAPQIGPHDVPMNPTPAQGSPAAIPPSEQAVYDAGQDARLRDHSQHLHALDGQVAALLAGRAPTPAPPTVVSWPRLATGVLTTLVTGALIALAGTRDTVRDNVGRIAALEHAHQESVIEARAESSRRLTDDRSSREQLAAIQSDLRALRVQVDLALSQRPVADELNAPRHHRR